MLFLKLEIFSEKLFNLGVFDVVPPETIAHLSPEDFRLILCGTQEISVALLKSFTKFSDESSAPTEVLARYKQQFWSVVNKFTNAEKQVILFFALLIENIPNIKDLIFFWTGSPTLPPTGDTIFYFKIIVTFHSRAFKELVSKILLPYILLLS